jgi:uncharacterized OB-fold protein
MALMPVRRDLQTAFFFDGAARGEFILLRDVVTGDLLDPRTDTSWDRERFEPVPASGRATVVSWAVPHIRMPSGDVRTVVGIVELDEGPWWWTEIRGADPDTDLLGARVVVGFEKSGPSESDETIPYFTMER